MSVKKLQEKVRKEMKKSSSDTKLQTEKKPRSSQSTLSPKTSILIPKQNVAQTPLQKASAIQRREVFTDIPKASFQKLVKSVVLDSGDFAFRDEIRFNREAIIAIQLIAEDFIIRLFEDSSLCAFHAKRITVNNRDVRLVLRLRKMFL
ncbi:histone H3, putative [Entamoeba invadens IP1]|uniref:Histone H3, putative n=1 Tax=Entamoeba invadens IP1 TaxID=370355 RepID=A0A0A1UH78_ENTIV|nr:histone H3, putative [Entamoeba invadens IP1]ELP94847.1 histone H3, putative [Entamoeba invadens IP1]|eukprot:XP_004261618.1 histone H3, putative [Entamoeba invadens IP1]